MNVPPEIQEFLNRDGVILLIRGLPGTGKTIFALSLLNSRDDCAYITTSKVLRDINRNFSWVGETAKKKIFVIDEKYGYEEASQFKNIFYLLPTSFRHVLNKVEKGEIKTVILDSWHTILQELKYKEIEERERKEIYDPERFFLNLIKLSDLGLNIIITKEGTEEDPISYVADGVLTLHKHIENGRMQRGLTIEKLRGMRIEKPEYVISLKDGRANTLRSSSFQHPRNLKEFKGIPIKMGGGIPSAVFDDIIKFRRGYTIFYDFEEYVPREYHLTIIMSTLVNFLKNEKSGVIIPPNDMDSSEIKYQIYLFSLEKQLGNLRVIYNERELENFVQYVDFSNEKSIAEIVEKYLDESHTPLVILGYDRLYSYLNSNQIMQLLDYLRNEIRKRSGILIISGKVSDKEIKRFCAGFSDIYIKFNNVDGDVIMYGIKPWTATYHLDLHTKEGYPKIKLEEIL